MVLQLQQYQQQAQTIILQKQQIETQLTDVMSALESLEETKDKDVYKAVGPILAKMKAKDVKKELDDRRETLELRIKTLTRQEGKVNEKVTELSDKVTKLLQGAAGPVV